jgi:hypothetical protein
MDNNYTSKLFWLAVLCFTAQFAGAQTLLHYWNFNSLPDGTATNVAADFSLVTGTTSITYPGTGTGYMDDVDGDPLNAQNGDLAGLGLRPRNPSNTRDLLIAFPTTGYSDIVVKFATTKTNQGATQQIYTYSTDGGATYTNADLPVTTFNPVTDVYNLVTLDFSGIPAADNNPNFIVKISFGGATAAGTSGNNRFDNISVTSGGDTQPATTSVSFAEDFVVVNEDAGTFSFVLNVESPTASSVDLVVKGVPFSTANSGDFTLANHTINFTAASASTHTVTIPIINDTEEEQHAEYFVLSLENPQGVTITGETLATIYIKDNDRLAPVPNHEIELEYLVSFDPSGASTSTCEIVVYDPASQRLFTTSAVAGFLDIINFSNPAAPAVITSVDMNPYGGVTSVAVKNGIVAVASPNTQQHLDGSVVFFNTDGVFQKQVTVGALPDNISFTPDGTKVLTANEGQPNSDYSTDPEGSVSIIDISGGIASLTQANVTTLLFTDYNTQEAALLAEGVRKLKLTSTMSQDFEPEYITTSADSQKAWVTLQENNAIAEISLTTVTITDVWALGTKDMSLMGNGADISDNNGEILIANWPIKSYYIPDAVATYSVAGTNYIITANEGDEKEYDNFEERTTVGAGGYVLDPANFPHAAMLKKGYNAGRMRVTNLHGNTDADNEFEEIRAVGSRSFSIFNADTKELVYDSGDDFEMYTAFEPSINALFNSDSEENELKGRSRAKGPEPEGVTIAQIAGKTFAFISLERIGGVMVYDVTDPDNVEFVDYKNSRSVSAYEGDHGPEGITYINSTDSPDDKNYIVVANEISGTISVYEVNAENLSAGNYPDEPKTFNVFPNPSVDGIAYFNRTADIEVYDMSGKLIYSAKDALTINTSAMETGIYLIKTSEGIAKKLVVK